MNKFVKSLCCFAVGAILIFPSVSNAEEKKVEIGVSAWGRTIFAPGVSDNLGETTSTTGASWGGNGGRIGWTIKGTSENVGFQVDMNCDGGGIGFQDQQKVWAKPFEFLTVEIGPSVFYEVMRGDAVFGAWNWMRFSEMDDEDAIFVRGKAGGGDQNQLHQNASGIQGGWTRDNGVYAGSITHIDVAGFHLFAALDNSKGSLITEDDEATTVNEEVREKYSSADMFKRGQYGAGYEIPNIGMIRAQYIGKAYLKEADDDKLTSYGIVNAAFKIDKLVENLYIDLGVFVPTEEQKKTGDSEGYTSYNAYLRYTAGPVTLHATGQTKLDKMDKDGEEGTAIHAGIGADIAISSVSITTDFRYMNNNWNANPDVDDTLACLVGVSRGFSNGKIGIGFEYSTTSFMTDATKEKNDDPMWSIPIVIEYWF